MRQQDHGRVVRHMGQRRVQVVRATMRPPGQRQEGDLAVQPGQPEARLQAQGAVLERREARLRQRLHPQERAAAPVHGRVILPPVMVARDGVAAQRRAQPGQQGADLGVGIGRAYQGRVRAVIAQQHHEVRRLGIGGGDDGGDAVQRHGRRAGVQVGQRGDPQRAARRPAWR
ncbi:hypothetical protein GGQ83_001255 [Roseococcus suduntuyensis]|uniref:Uncharacterized protein n=1 Tax=Roseococcus suduntuyensis TaxID=455361 RepID=A0A840A8H8_9PROT|nr:hypothetical protein [Roseococcus suduntuyensis]